MRTFVNFLLSGFGTGTAAGRALGITILICLSAFIIAIYLIRWIISLFRRRSPQPVP